MTMTCPDKQYFDEAVGRCAGCHSICYGSSLHDINSDCNRFCPDMMARLGGADDSSNMSSSSANGTEIALFTCLAIVIVSILLGVLIWKRFGNRRHTPQDFESQEIAAIQETGETSEPVQETAMSELHFGSYPNDPMLSNSEC